LTDILDEISEEIRKENFSGLVKKYGKSLGLIVFLILLAVAVYVAQGNYRRSLKEKAVSEYLNAVNLLGNNSTNQGIVALSDIIARAPHPVKDMAALRAAAYQLEHGKRPEALDIYSKLSTDSAADGTFRNLATILLAKNIVGNQAEEKKYDIKNRLEAASNPEAPFRASVYEMLALIGIENNDSENARKYLLLISTNPAAAEWSKKRAEALLAGYEK